MSRKQRLSELLHQNFNHLQHLTIENESHRHHVPENSETHFKVTLVSEEFCGVSLVQRQRRINQLFKEEFNQGLHALSMHLLTPEEWQKKQQKTIPSPACRDGYHHG